MLITIVYLIVDVSFMLAAIAVLGSLVMHLLGKDVEFKKIAIVCIIPLAAFCFLHTFGETWYFWVMFLLLLFEMGFGVIYLTRRT